MRAYVFWHYPFANLDTRDYEAALLAFHAALASAPPPGLKSSTAFRTSNVPWLGDRDGYEDWYFLDSSADLDSLNEAAVIPERWTVHAAVASKMEYGRGGLYGHLYGAEQPLQGSKISWLKRPRGIRYERPLQDILESASGFISCWRVQMVLGPADEFAVIGTADLRLTLPSGWQSRTIERTALAPTP